MPHETPLLTTIVVGLSFAFVLGAITQRIGISPLVGYLLAGVAVGPFTPGLVVDQALAQELAELGVILLMFGVGLHFSLTDLLSVRAIAIPGAVAQIAVASLLGLGLAWTLGWSIAGGLVFGLALSVASTVVLLRAVQERRLIETERGRIAVGWLIVEDLAMVLALVMLPALGGSLPPNATGDATSWALAAALALTFGKVVAFVALMLIVGRRLVPWVLDQVAGSGSREMFRLAVLTIALGVAFAAAKLFAVSFALGAFFAGMVMSESELSHEAAEESIPHEPSRLCGSRQDRVAPRATHRGRPAPDGHSPINGRRPPESEGSQKPLRPRRLRSSRERRRHRAHGSGRAFRGDRGQRRDRGAAPGERY